MPKSSKAELVSFMVTGAACEGLAPAPGDPDDEQPVVSAAAAKAEAAASRSAGEDGT